MVFDYVNTFTHISDLQMLHILYQLKGNSAKNDRVYTYICIVLFETLALIFEYLVMVIIKSPPHMCCEVSHGISKFCTRFYIWLYTSRFCIYKKSNFKFN